MHLGKKLAALLIGAILAAAGCADGGLVTSSEINAPNSPAYDGIGWAGSGNRTEPDSSNSAAGSGWAGSGNFAENDSTTTITTEDRIGWAGSGN
jgi:hypothetical protein